VAEPEKRITASRSLIRIAARWWFWLFCTWMIFIFNIIRGWSGGRPPFDPSE
jgi:hypothetical protein